MNTNLLDFYNSLPYPILYLDKNTLNVVNCSDNFFNIRNDVIGKHIDYILQNSKYKFQEFIQQSNNDILETFFKVKKDLYYLDTKDNKILVKILCSFHDDLIIVILSSILDSSDNSLYLAELNQKIIESVPLGINLYNQEGNCYYVSSKSSIILGQKKENILKTNFINDNFWKEYGLYEIAIEAINNNITKSLDISFMKFNNEKINLSLNFVPFKKDDNIHLMLTMIDNTDMDEFKKDFLNSESELTLVREKFNILFESVDEGVLLCDENFNIIDHNQKLYHLLKIENSEKNLINKSIQDLPLSNSSLIVQNIREQKNKIFLSRVLKDNVETLYNIQAIKTKLGDKFYYYLIFRIITEQEQNLKQLTLAQKVFDNAIEAIVITNANNDIISINRAFTRITGYELEEVFGKNPKILSVKDKDPDFYKNMWASIKDNGFWSGEITDRAKNGKIYQKWLNITSFKNSNGEIENYIGVFTDISNLKDTKKKLEQLALYDALTGLKNRTSLSLSLQQSIKQAQRDNKYLAVAFLDLDNFKTINDSLGHQFGDLLLIEVANRIKNNIREVDIACRIGGDEFIIVYNGIKDIKNVQVVANKLLHSLSEPYILNKRKLFAPPSIGISLFPQDGNTAENLIKNADAAMYHAKENGKKNYQFFTEELNNQVKERLSLETDLRKAIQDKQLMAYFQPQINVINNETIGFEALLRWKHPKKGFISPALFIPIAEETGLINQVGDVVIEAVCQFLQQLGKKDYYPKVAINLSAKQLNQKGVSQHIKSIFSKYCIYQEQIEFEITESSLVGQRSVVLEEIDKLKEMNFKLSIDDFGTGYSSLAYLSRLPLSKLKIDKSFIDHVDKNKQDEMIVASIIGLAKNLNLEVIAEGVETQEQINWLKQHDCLNVQGYFYSKPLSPEDTIKWIEENKFGVVKNYNTNQI